MASSELAPNADPEIKALPLSILAALRAPVLERRGWQSRIAPTFIGLFLWIVFYDQIPKETIPLGGVGWPVLGVLVGGVLCYLLLYYPSAIWGMRTGRPIGIVATSTFGVEGAGWIPGLLLAITQVVWLAVSTYYGTTLSLLGLQFLGFLDPQSFQFGFAGRSERATPLFLVSSLTWCFAAAFVGRYLVRVIAALMNVFPILPAFMLGLTAVFAMKGFTGFRPEDQPPSLVPGSFHPGVYSMLIAVQMILGFFCSAGLSSADWGAVTSDEKDVRLGGWVGVGLGRLGDSNPGDPQRGVYGTEVVAPRAARVPAVDAHRFIATIPALFSPRVAGAMLMGFGLAALAPACYSSYNFSSSLHDRFPRVSRSKWTIVAACLAWLVVMSGRIDRLFDVFSVLGAVLAPACGALAADYFGRVEPGPGRGAASTRRG